MGNTCYLYCRNVLKLTKKRHLCLEFTKLEGQFNLAQIFKVFEKWLHLTQIPISVSVVFGMYFAAKYIDLSNFFK